MIAGPDIARIERRLSGARLRLGVLARVKNECDIIEAFVRHHCALVDRVIVVDNVSHDGTAEILAALVDEGLPLTVFPDETLEYRQSDITSYLARASIRGFELDRLFLLDADEFLHVGSRGALDAALEPFHGDEHLLLPWATYVPEADADDVPGPAPRTIVRRRRSEAIPTYKVAVAGAFAGEHTSSIAMGNHAVSIENVAQASPIAHGLRLAHFPVRSSGQLHTKAALAWTAYLAMGYAGGGLGDHWKALSEAYEGGSPVPLRAYAFAYQHGAIDFSEDELVADPVHFAHEMRYAARAIPNPARTIALTAQQIARRYAELRTAVDGMRPEIEALEARLVALESSPV